jgi:hypothetical protein
MHSGPAVASEPIVHRNDYGSIRQHFASERAVYDALHFIETVFGEAFTRGSAIEIATEDIRVTVR